MSVLDVETHIDTMGVGQEVTKATGSRVKLEHSTESLLSFDDSGAKSVPDSATGEEKGDAKSTIIIVVSILSKNFQEY
jgi:hypothetical protein